MTTTLEQAARWVTDAMGKSWPADKAEMIVLTNDIRELIYDTSVLPWLGTLCVPIRSFCQECDTYGCFSGVSLPNYVSNVLGIYVDGRAVPVVDRWGIYPYDEESLCSSSPYKFTDLGEEYPFICDPPCGSCYKIVLFAKNKADAGKVVTLRFLDANDYERTELLTLGNLPVSTQYTVKAIARNGVSLPLGLVGGVSVKTDGGVKLSDWQPWEIVPGYRRLRLDADCRAFCNVVVHFERRRVRICSMTDPVETDQKLIWESGARYLYLHRKTSADAGDMQNEQKYLAAFTSKLEEAGRRLKGRTHKRALNFRSLTPRRSGLVRGR